MIYLYYLLVGEEVKYVGLTKNPKDRKYKHKRSKPIHEFKIIEKFDDVNIASDKERIHILIHETLKNGWNKSAGGEYAGNSGYLRTGIGGVKKGQIPWNKGLSGYTIHNEEYKNNLSKVLSGKNNPRAILKDNQVKDIIECYINKPSFNGIGEIMKNGIPMSYDRIFSKIKSLEYNVTPENIDRIIKKKTWKKLWEQYE